MSDLQKSDVTVTDGKITGTLKWFDTPGAIVDVWGAGNFLALKFTADDWSDYDEVLVGLNPSAGSGFVDVKPDPDKNGIFKISDTESQVFEIICKKDDNRVSRTYDLTGLVLESDEA